LKEVRAGAGVPLIVFTDLDGTLLDSATYSAAEAHESLDELRERGVPVVFCSSKTAAEQRFLRRELGVLDAPFIVENGSAVFLPARDGAGTHDSDEEVEVLGVSAVQVRSGIRRAAAALGLETTGYSDLSASQVAALTGLDEAAAERARKREFSETLVDRLTPSQWKDLDLALAAEGLCARQGGKFRTITSVNADKGRAVRLVTSLYAEKASHPFVTAGLGDSSNDESMLEVVDRPYVVSARALPHLPNLHRTMHEGPRGWAEAIQHLLRTIQLGERRLRS
jgi:mannosyl-3-phosphoglycerate phosphatase family protein